MERNQKEEFKLVPDVQKPIMNVVRKSAVGAFEKGDFDEAVRLLWPLRDNWTDIGGSHAQRDLFAQILLDATIGAKRYDMAQTLLSQRLTLRPKSVGGWQKYAQVLQAAGDTDKANVAALRAQCIQ